MVEVEILSIDSKIQENFQKEKEKLPLYEERLIEFETTLKLDNLSTRTRNSLLSNYNRLKEHITGIRDDSLLNFYIADTITLIERYKEILSTPVKMNFMGKPLKNNKEKTQIINQYLEIAEKYIDVEIKQTEKKFKIVCNNCSNKELFDNIDYNIYVCLNCFSQQMILYNMSSYKDIDRVNISAKYTYDRRVHFRDCINQYQGKQNSTIEQKVYDDLEDQFEKHHLLVGDKDTPKEERFKNISREHVQLFLKELNYTKHYENCILIHYNFTGEKPDDISHLEDALLNDFDTLTELYDKKYKQEQKIERKNFINTQYVLYQLLMRHKHSCKKENFPILKTIDRQLFHDEIVRPLFLHLGWNMQSLI